MASDSGPAPDDREPFEVMGIPVHVDPTMPPDCIEIRDAETGEVRAYWGEHGVFEVLPPRPWRSLGRTADGGEVWTAPIGTPPPGDAPEARTS